jgi:hypothetical protein
MCSYLSIAPILGGMLYLGSFFVQQAFPAIFPVAYFASVAIFALPIIVLIVRS